jgi:hypothetical protein
MAEGIVYFMSKSPSCLVAFEEIRKEYKGNPVPWQMEKFANARLEIDPRKDYGSKRGMGHQIIKRLRNHRGNRSKGGDIFYELDQNTVDVMQIKSGMLVARDPKGGIPPALDKKLEKFYGYIDDYPEDEHDQIIDEIGDLFDMFSVMGIEKPKKSFGKIRVKGRLIEFFGILEEREIWEPLEK